MPIAFRLSARAGRLALAAGAGAVALAFGGSALASSHREAPFIAMQPSVDGTDFYMFRSYEAGRQDFVTVIANYIPFQDPQGGPNFYQFNPNAQYEIHFDNDGDGKEDITFQFRFTSTSKHTALPIGGKPVQIPLINSGTISGVNPDSLNVRETFTVNMVRGDRRTGTSAAVTAAGGAAQFDKPVDNIGDKTFGSTTGYETYANQHIYDIAIPGCSNGRMFVGQRKEPFYIAVGKIFDLFNLNPLGPEVSGNNNDLEHKNISSIVMELPISCLATASDPVVGGWTTSSLRQGRLLNPSPELRHQQRHGGRRRLVAGLAARHAAGQRGRDRARRQGPVQHVQAGQRRAVRQIRDQSDLPGAGPDALPVRHGTDQLPAHRPGRGVPDRYRRPQPAEERRARRRCCG